MRLPIFIFLLLCFIPLLAGLKSIPNFGGIFQAVLHNLQRYNDKSIESVVVLYPEPVNMSQIDEVSPCGYDSNIQNNEDIWWQHVYIVGSKHYISKLQKVLTTSRKSLVIVCSEYPFQLFSNIFKILPGDFFSENMWVLINSLIRYEVNSTDTFDARLKSSGISLSRKVQIDFQIYFLEGSYSQGILFELYCPCPGHEVVIRKIIQVSNQGNILFTSDFIWKRRQNLMGCSIRAGYLEQKYGFYETKTSEHCPRRIRGTNKMLCIADQWYISIVNQLIVDFNMSCLLYTSPSPRDS